MSRLGIVKNCFVIFFVYPSLESESIFHIKKNLDENYTIQDRIYKLFVLFTGGLFSMKSDGILPKWKRNNRKNLL